MNNKQITDDIDSYTIQAEKRRILKGIEYIRYTAARIVETERMLSISMSNFLDAVEKKCGL
jgi:hypothetical protein